MRNADNKKNMYQNITIADNTQHSLTVNRLVYGTVRLTGEGIYEEPPNRNEALQILKHVVSNGVKFLDTADYYGEQHLGKIYGWCG